MRKKTKTLKFLPWNGFFKKNSASVFLSCASHAFANLITFSPDCCCSNSPYEKHVQRDFNIIMEENLVNRVT